MREVPFSAIQFPIFEGLKSSWSNYQGSPVDSVQVGLCGSVAGGFAAAITTPLDVTKTRLMLGAPEGKAPYVGCAHDNVFFMGATLCVQPQRPLEDLCADCMTTVLLSALSSTLCLQNGGHDEPYRC